MESGRTDISLTSVSLLEKLRDSPTDKPSWNEFVNRYGPRIQAWCLAWGLQPADADDVTQNVLLAVSRQIDRFEYNPNGRFRSWLKTVTRRAWCDSLERRKKTSREVHGDSILMVLSDDAAPNSLIEALDEECQREILEVAMRRVEKRVQAQTWQAFHLTEIQQMTPDDAAARLEMKAGSVYVARNRIRKMLISEVERLESASE